MQRAIYRVEHYDEQAEAWQPVLVAGDRPVTFAKRVNALAKARLTAPRVASRRTRVRWGDRVLGEYWARPDGSVQFHRAEAETSRTRLRRTHA